VVYFIMASSGLFFSISVLNGSQDAKIIRLKKKAILIMVFSFYI